jgi:hypothetical protein
MQKLLCLLVAGLAAPLLATQAMDELPDRCTTIAVAKLPSGVGPMNTHNADCAECDFRLNKQPARDWPAGTKRPLYLYKTTYPSTVSSERGDTWLPSNLEGTAEQKAAWGQESVIEGFIDQVGSEAAAVLCVLACYVLCYACHCPMTNKLHEIYDVCADLSAF